MFLQRAIFIVLSSTTFAFKFSSRQSDGCPSVWTLISSDLQSEFAGCNDNARAAIRMPLHDCLNNGCDGSLILADECARAENAGLQDTCSKLGDKASRYDVGIADMIQFSAAVAIAICPLGPRVQALVGREDSSVAAPEGELPASSDPVDTILAAFSAKGFSAADVVALVGAHTTARQFLDDPARAGAALDSTDAAWDVAFYSQTLTGTAPYSLSSDKRLSLDLQTAPTWLDFSLNQAGWNAAFTNAWNRFSVLGSDAESLTDCSSALPGAAKTRRDAKSAPIAERAFIPKMKS